jgi:hypothetical protein
VALCQARTSTKPLWGLTSSNPYHSQSRAEQYFFIIVGPNVDYKSNLNFIICTYV